MSAKWRKIIWVILDLQLFLLHVWLINKLTVLDNLVYRVVRHFNLPNSINVYWKWLLIAGWLLVATVILFFQYFMYTRFRHACIAPMEPVRDNHIKDIFYDAARECNIIRKKNFRKKKPNFMYSSKEVKTPFIIGFIHPILLIPKEEAENKSLPMIFSHECRHVKSHDTRYKLFLLVTQSLLWYQPISYLLKQLGFRDIEVACDEAVIAGKSKEERAEYGQVLLNSLKSSGKRSLAYSTYFYNSKQIMKARISAVMDRNRKWDSLAVLTILLLLFETGLLTWQFADGTITKHKEAVAAKEAEENLYTGYDLPDSFTDTALQSMLSLTPAGPNAYITEFQSNDQYEEKEFAALPYAATGPWQVRIKDADRYADTINLLLSRYLYYFEDQETGSTWNPEEAGSCAKAEIVNERLLAGDKHDAVFSVICREYIDADYQNLEAYKNGWAKIAYEDGTYYAYYNLAVHIKMTADYVFELEGIANNETVLAAFQEKYPEIDFSDVPSLDLRYDCNKAEKEMMVHIQEDALEISESGDTWETVPVEVADVLDRGDTMDGALTTVQDGSYQLNQNKKIFAYGGSSLVPLSVTYFDEKENKWFGRIVSTNYPSVRRVFVSFPVNGDVGFLVLTCDRTMSQEGTVLFQTTNGGNSWKETRPARPDISVEPHFLTTGMVFITDKVGFITIRDSETPQIWRTADSGATWEKLSLDSVPENYCMAYPPEVDGDTLKLYVGMEENEEYGGSKALYVSNDQGVTWEFKGLTIRK